MPPGAHLIVRLWKRLDGSVRARLFIPTAVLATAAIGLMAVVATEFYAGSLRRVQEERGQLFAGLMTEAVQAYAASYRHDDLTPMLKELQQHREDVEGLRVINGEGRVGSTTSGEPLGTQAWNVSEIRNGVPHLMPDGEGFVILQPMLNNERCDSCHGKESRMLGWLELRFSKEPVRQAKRQLTLTLALAAVPSLLFLLGISWLLLGWEAVTPLQRLVAAMKRAAAGQQDVRADNGRPDEIGIAARGFDATLTALRNSQAELERMYQERMMRADRFAMVGQMASGLAHEIKNPLAGLSGALELLAEDLAGTAHSEVIAEMRHQVARLSKIMEEMLSFARPPKAQKQPTDLNAVLEKVLFLVGQQRRKAPVRIVSELFPELPLVHGDPAQLEQVMLNICLNASQILTEGGTVKVRSMFRQELVVVEVADSGPGIPPEVRPHIFTPFFTTRANGTGLGLAISHRIVTEHGGNIWFDCPPGGGTIFSVALPVMTSQRALQEAV